MFQNSPENPVDFFTYVKTNDGAPVWVYVDTDIMEVPEGTKGLTFILDKPPEERTPDDIWCFQEPVDAAQWHNYFRLEHWPKNVFRSLQDGYFEMRRSPGPGGEEDPPEELLDEASELYYYKVEFEYPDDEVTDTSIWPRDPYTSFQNFCVPHERGPRTFEVATNTWDRPASLSRTIAAIESGATSLPQWVFCSDGECEFVERRTQYCMIHLRSDGDAWSNDIEHRDIDPVDGAYSIPYYRQSGWPSGLFRLLESYRYEDTRIQVPADVIGESVGRARNIIMPARVGLDYVRKTDLQYASDIQAQIVAAAEFEPSAQEWWIWESSPYADHDEGTIHFARRPGQTSTYHEYEAGFVNRAGTNGNENPIAGDPTYQIGYSLYRYERWPNNVYCNAWSADGEPVYGADAFGIACSGEDETSPDSPLTDPDNFDFQKWVKFSAWHPQAGNHQMGRTVWIGRNTIEPDSFYAVNGNVEAAFTAWSNEHREHQATYFRRRHFPEGVYRRLDVCELQTGDSWLIRRLDHPDAPPLSEVGAPWHSARLKAWVEAIEQDIGRTIYPDPSQGSPWLRIWDPEEAETQQRTFDCLLDGRQVSLSPGRQRAHSIGFDQDVLDYFNCEHGNQYGVKYRLGVDLLLDPCSVRYTAGIAPPEGSPENPLDVYLEKIEPFFRNYRDPDIVADLAESMYAQVAAKKNAFQGDIDRANRAINHQQEILHQKVQALAQIYESMSYYDTMSEAKFKATLQANEALIRQHGTLKHRNETLTLTLNEFEVQGQPLGPMNIKLTYGRGNFAVSVHAVPGCQNLSQHGHVHPHVHTSGGRICWGNGSQMAEALAKGIDPLEFLFATAIFLKTGYTPGDAYCRIGQWRRVETWYCDPCRDDHPQGQPCPNVCPTCTEQVFWDDHGRCETHNACWDYNDRETCPICDEAQTTEGETSAAE